MPFCQASFDNDFDYGSQGDGHYQAQSPTASSPKGQGWAQRVKGWFTSVRFFTLLKNILFE